MANGHLDLPAEALKGLGGIGVLLAVLWPVGRWALKRIVGDYDDRIQKLEASVEECERDRRHLWGALARIAAGEEAGDVIREAMRESPVAPDARNFPG